MAEAESAPTQESVKHQRQLRNFLLDRKFQLKYAGYLMGIALGLSLAFCIILGLGGSELVGRGRALVEESRKVSAVVEMNIVKEYGDNPELLAAFRDSDAREGASALERHQVEFERQIFALGTVLFSSLALFVLAVGIAGILVTHKVAGPVYKMKRHINEVADGHLRLPGRLRKGDELVDFFNAFDRMVRTLRERKRNEIELLDVCIRELEALHTGEDTLRPLHDLRKAMQAALDD